MNNNKAKEIFSKVADALEMSVDQVVAKYESGDADVVKWVRLAVKMHA